MIAEHNKLETRLERMATELEEDRTKLREKLSEIDEKRDAVQKELDRVEDVIATIHGKPATTKRGRPAGPRGTGFNKEELIHEIADILKKRQAPLEKDQIKAELLERARTHGKTGKGMAVLLKHALKSDRFSGADGHYELSTN